MRNILPAIAALVISLTASAAAGETLTLKVMNSAGNLAVENAVVEVIAPAGAATVPRTAVVDQIDKEFSPPVTVIPRGGQVSFPNSDDILHHVYSFSSAKTFDIPLYGRSEGEGYSQLFDVAGVVEIGCNIHDWMLAFVYVSDAQQNGLTGPDGLVTLQGLVPGAYQLRIWHPQLVNQEGVVFEVNVIVGVTTEHTANVELGRDRRIRRAPSTSRGRYR